MSLCNDDLSTYVPLIVVHRPGQPVGEVQVWQGKVLREGNAVTLVQPRAQTSKRCSGVMNETVELFVLAYGVWAAGLYHLYTKPSASSNGVVGLRVMEQQ